VATLSASAAASPLAYYKFFAHDGGMRVPLIISGPGIAAGGRISDAFAYVTDIAPTLLDFAGVPAAAGEYAGRRVETISGTSLRALVTGGVERVHAPEQAIGYELGGNAALFEGDHKIVRDRGPVGDGEWHLFDIARDPGETHDLKLEMPSRFAAMLDAYRKYEVENGVLPVPDAYDQRQQVTLNAIRSRLGPYLGWLVAAAAAVLGALGLAIARRRRHRAA